MKQLMFTIPLCFLLVCCSTPKPLGDRSMDNLLDKRKYAFIAQNAYPARTSAIAVSGSGYELKVMDDSVNLYLPFYGRSTGNMSGGPLQLSTKEFTYTSTKTKSRWEILIIPTRATDIRQIQLSISENGNANLLVMSRSRDNMNYSGTINDIR